MLIELYMESIDVYYVNVNYGKYLYVVMVLINDLI